MMRFHATLLALIVLPLSATRGQEPIRMARTPALSPDGKLIAFSYLGDIWTVEAIGGVARPVTQHLAHDIAPVFSPDGRSLAFASNRHGSYDVFVVPTRGGKPRRLTFDSAADFPSGWSPDGKHILFYSNRSASFPPRVEMYTVPVEGGRVRRVSASEGRDGAYSPKGDRIAYVRGPGAWYRKGYRGSSNNDIWICDADGRNNRCLTTFNGQDGSPMWSADGQRLYYVSEVFGTPANLVRQDVNSASKPVLVTTTKDGKPFHTSDGVRLARISGDGKWIVYECGADLWIVSTAPGSTPRRLAIEAYADDKTNPERTVTFSSRATEFALSRDEHHVAFVVHGELFVKPVGGDPHVRRLTNHPANDHGIAWSPDGMKIIFLSDRNGYEDLYLLESDDPDHRKVAEAHQFKVKQLTNTREAESGVTFAPNGKVVTFLRGGKLWSMKPDGSDVKVLVDTPLVFDYEWSPDSKWIVYARADGSFASELYIIPSGGGKARNVTRFATYNGGVTWSADGKKLCFLSDRKGTTTGVYVMSLQKEAAPGAASSDEIDWDDIHHRVVQPTTMPVREAAISIDGARVAFSATSQGSTDLWVAASNGSSVTRLTTGNLGPTQITWSRRLPTVLYFRDSAGRIHIARIPLGAISPPTTGETAKALHAPLPFKARMTVRDAEVYAEMFEQSWRSLADHFYDPKLHGVNWDAVRERYRPLVKHIGQKEDLYSLLYLMLGELNASHLGVAGPTKAPEQDTADLGLLFDESYHGRGLKIIEVLKRGPADKRGITLRPGEYVLAIDSTELTPGTNISRVLNDKVGETVLLLVSTDPAAPLKGKGVRRVEIKGVSRSAAAKLLYERWVEENARRVSELSKGKLGYIHIPSMNEAGLERFVRALYSDNFDKEAIVLDVRYNGGGFTHDQVLNYLGSREHTFFRQRYGGQGMVLRSYDRKWNRPTVLLINNRSYSDAEIFPHAFRTLGLGKLVGQATGGFVIGTTSTRLIDGSLFRLPRTGVYTVQGINMEKEGVKPDVEVIPHPDELARGLDAQLDKAVDVLQVEVARWKKGRPSVAARGTGGRPMPPTVSAPPMPPADK
jgi:tricorn protease